MSLTQPWTMEQLDTLRSMWAEGRTAREIGAVLKRTRNSILGKAHRLGLPKHQGANTPRKPDTRVGRVRTFPKQRNKRLPPMHFKVIAVPDTVSVTLNERTGCCYPTTNESPHLFCNAPKSTGDYCEFHYQLMYPKRRAA